MKFVINSHSLKHKQNTPGNISSTADGWTTNNMKGSFLGMTAHWIDVEASRWTMRSEVGLKGVSGAHSGWNLGQYCVGLCDYIGICSSNKSKVCYR